MQWMFRWSIGLCVAIVAACVLASCSTRVGGVAFGESAPSAASMRTSSPSTTFAAPAAMPTTWVSGDRMGAQFLDLTWSDGEVAGSLTTYSVGRSGSSSTLRVDGTTSGTSIEFDLIGDNGKVEEAKGTFTSARISLIISGDDHAPVVVSLTPGSEAEYRKLVASLSGDSKVGRKVFDQLKIEAGVTVILTSAVPAGFGLTSASGVVCPPNEPVQKGLQFECTATIGGDLKHVKITVIDDEGRYEVGVPQ